MCTVIFLVEFSVLEHEVNGLPVKPGCDPDKLDECGSELVIFGTGHRIPETEDELRQQCRYTTQSFWFRTLHYHCVGMTGYNVK